MTFGEIDSSDKSFVFQRLSSFTLSACGIMNSFPISIELFWLLMETNTKTLSKSSVIANSHFHTVTCGRINT